MRLKAVGTILPSTPSAGRSGEQERSTAHGALPATFEGVDAAEMVVGVARYELGVFDLLFLPAETTGGGGVAKHDALSTGEGSLERLAWALASANATKPLSASSSIPSQSNGEEMDDFLWHSAGFEQATDMAGVEHVDCRFEGLGCLLMLADEGKVGVEPADSSGSGTRCGGSQWGSSG